VPTGIKLPTIIASFNPSRVSVLPAIAASARTFVVSWNDEADKNESEDKAALVNLKSKTL